MLIHEWLCNHIVPYNCCTCCITLMQYWIIYQLQLYLQSWQAWHSRGYTKWGKFSSKIWIVFIYIKLFYTFTGILLLHMQSAIVVLYSISTNKITRIISQFKYIYACTLYLCMSLSTAGSNIARSYLIVGINKKMAAS